MIPQQHHLDQRGPTTGPRVLCGPWTEFLRPTSFLSIDGVYVAVGNFNQNKYNIC